MPGKPTYEELARRVRELEAAEAELRASRNRYRTLFEDANDAIFVASADTGIILDANQKAELLTGRPRNDIIGMHQTDLHPAVQKESTLSAFRDQTLNQKGRTYIHFHVQHKNGDLIPVEISQSMIEYHRKPCVLGIFRDVTEKRERIESLKRYEAVIKAVTDPVSYVDRDYIYRIVSDAYLRYSGKPREAIIGQPVWEILGKEPFENIVRPHLDRCFEGETVRYEDWFSFPDGTCRFQEIGYYPVFDDDGKEVVGASVFSRDHTARKVAERALKASEEKFKKTFDTDLVAIAISRRRDGMYLEANPGFQKVTGYAHDEIVGRTSLEQGFLSPEQRAELVVGLEQKGWLNDQELTFKTKNGDYKTIIFSIGSITLTDEDCFLATMVDITERKKAEEALKASEAKYRRLLDTLEEGYLRADLHGHTVTANAASAKLFGFASPEEMLGVHMSELYANPAERDGNIEKLKKNRFLANYEVAARAKNGRHFWTSCNSRLIVDEHDEMTGTEALIRDITEHKRAVEALRESEKRYRMVVRDQTEVISRFLPDGTFTLVNPVYCDFFGKNEHELLGRKWTPVAHPDDMERVQSKLSEISPANPVITIENRVYSGKGRLHWFMFVNRGFFDSEGRLSEIQSVGRDITDRKRAEEALKESEARFRRIVETAEEGIWLVDRNWETEFVNARMAEMLGYRPEEMLGRYLLSFMDAQEQRQAKELMARREQGVTEKHDFKFRCRDGSVLWAIISTNAVISEDGQFMHALAMVTDITDRKHAEEELKKKTHDLGERVKELNCLYEISRIIETPELSLDETMQGIAEFIPTSWQYPEITCARIILKDREYKTENFMETRWKQSSKIFVHGKHEGFLELSYLEERPEMDEGPFVKEERFLINAIGERLGIIIGQKKAEAALQKSLSEKEVLLREIHHRVKNNMQAISGLLRMHARRTDDAHLTEIFDDCRDRIGAMALIHEALYQSENLAKIDFKAYLKKLCRNLSQAHDAPRRSIDLKVSAADVSLNMDQGVAVGMIIAELISNAFKHAFPDDEEGTVSVDLDRPDGETARLVVSDTGKGLPPDFDISSSRSLGMRLVWGAVTRELGGSIDVERDNGARFIIRFK